jgi:integrase
MVRQTSAARRITVRLVDALKPGELAWDADVRGFGVRRQRDARMYVLKRRVAGVQRWLTIGEHGAPWTPETARREAQRLLGAIAGGKDPTIAREAARKAPTIDDLADRYLAEHVAVHNKPTTKRVVTCLLNAFIRPALGKRRARDIARPDIVKLHHDMRRTPRQANQTLAVVSKMMSCAEAWGWREDGTNPCKLVKRYAERQRERFLSDAELAQVGAAVAKLETAGKILPGAALAIRLAALTGCRLSELLALRWEDVDLEAGALAIRDAKAGGRSHAIGAPVVALLASVERTGQHVCWSTDPQKPMPPATLETAWARVRGESELGGVRFHDLRHTVGTYAGQVAANAFLVRDALGHKTLAMTGRYVNRDADPLRQLADRVSGRVAAALAGSEQTAHVVPMAKVRR